MSRICSVKSWKYKLKCLSFQLLPSGVEEILYKIALFLRIIEKVVLFAVWCISHLFSGHPDSMLAMNLRDPDTGMSNYYGLSDSRMKTQACFSIRKSIVYAECSNWDLETSQDNFVTVRCVWWFFRERQSFQSNSTIVVPFVSHWYSIY